MAKGNKKYLISFNSITGKFRETVPNNIILSSRAKVLIDDIINIICNSFVGKNFDAKNNLIYFHADDKSIDSVINECSNTGLFSERKVVVLRSIKKLPKEDKISLLNYLKKYNPDTCLIMTYTEEELNADKLFLFDAKAESENKIENKKIFESNVKVFEIDNFTDAEMIDWIKERFNGYKISEGTVKHFLQFTNYSFDEILSEIEKLKTYSYISKEITLDAVNLCNGIAKDFNEFDFIKAIVERNRELAMKIYDSISLKKDVEVYLVFLLSSAFIAINKLLDPEISKVKDFSLKFELKLWYEEQINLLPYYRQFGKSMNANKLKSAFENIYSTDKILKSSGVEKKTVMQLLINNLCNL